MHDVVSLAEGFMQVTYPGVYVREVPSGVRTVTGVSTGGALVVG